MTAISRARLFPSLLLLSLVLSACASGDLSRFFSENEMEPNRDLLEATDRLGMAARLATVAAPNGHRLELEVRQSHLGRPDHAVVFIHGVFSDHRTWRYVAGMVGAKRPVWLLNLPGCGRSSAPDPDVVGDNLYSPDSMASMALQAMEACLEDAPAFMRISLVGHSLGSTVILRMYSQENRERHRNVLARVQDISLIAPFDVAVARPDPFFEELANTSGLLWTFGRALGIVRSRVAVATAQLFDDPDKVPREEALNLLDIMDDTDRRRAAQAMLRVAAPWTEERRTDWERVEIIEADYGRLDTPCLILVGRRDETLYSGMSYKLAKQLPHASVRALERLKHSPQVEDPLRCADLLEEFFQSHRAAVARSAH